ncbi:MAG: pyruvate kinase, partial [Oscillospiraceae bacterium]|nr:pyruvate kinase [Oscillospiraceae bacterium]
RTGVENFDEILKAADGIMVARGDLGVEMDMEEVPLLQKRFIRKCNAVGKPVITATQMLDSMIRNARPTRAEVNDVANSILDGTDCIMLSGETASGKHPLEALRSMQRIAEYVEKHTACRISEVRESIDTGRSLTNAVSFACYTMATDLNAAAVITPTQAGHTARNVAKYRPPCQLIATTDHERTFHQLSLVWGVTPVRMASVTSTDDMVRASVDVVRKAGLLQDGDIAVISAGVPVGVSGSTNLIQVHVVGDVLLRGRGIGAGMASGRVCVVKDLAEAQPGFEPGDILVTHMTDNDMLPLIKKASALVVESGDLLCHAAVVGFALEIPVILDDSGQAVRKLKNGMRVSVDAAEGYVYNGEGHHRKG